MLDIFDGYGIVDIRLDEQHAQVYFNNGTSEWELYLSDGNILHLGSKQDAVNEGIEWVTRR